jgi:hypothetical protein
MPEYVAVIDEVADVRTPEVGTHRHARVGTGARPERHLDRVVEKYSVRVAVGVALANPAKRFPAMLPEATSVTGRGGATELV